MINLLPALRLSQVRATHTSWSHAWSLVIAIGHRNVGVISAFSRARNQTASKSSIHNWLTSLTGDIVYHFVENRHICIVLWLSPNEKQWRVGEVNYCSIDIWVVEVVQIWPNNTIRTRCTCKNLPCFTRHWKKYWQLVVICAVWYTCTSLADDIWDAIW